jgi:hypothetical protein
MDCPYLGIVVDTIEPRDFLNIDDVVGPDYPHFKEEKKLTPAG